MKRHRKKKENIIHRGVYSISYLTTGVGSRTCRSVKIVAGHHAVSSLGAEILVRIVGVPVARVGYSRRRQDRDEHGQPNKQQIRRGHRRRCYEPVCPVRRDRRRAAADGGYGRPENRHGGRAAAAAARNRKPIQLTTPRGSGA